MVKVIRRHTSSTHFRSCTIVLKAYNPVHILQSRDFGIDIFSNFGIPGLSTFPIPECNLTDTLWRNLFRECT